MSEEITERLVRIEEKLDAILRGGRPAVALAATGAVAPESELDSQYGNPLVRKDPKRWTESGGASCVGRKYAECPPDFLDALASLLEWQAGKDDEKGTPEGTKYAGYARKDAARARGWAKRIRSGWVPPASEAELGSAFSGGDIPF